MPPGAGSIPGAVPPGMPQQGGQQPQMSPQLMQLIQQMAAMGRNGDDQVAHLTTGEIAVPPQVQTPKVLATLNQAFDKSGVKMDQFTAGSPQSSHNPLTGAQEYNFMSAFLPIALGLAGSMIMPGIGTALGSSLGGATMGAIGGGLGSGLGGLLAGQSPTQALLSGAGAGLGGYALGSLGSGAGEAVSPAASSAASNAANTTALAGEPFVPSAELLGGMNSADAAATAAGATNAAKAATTVDGPMNLWGMLPHNINPLTSIGSAVGGQVGSMIGAPPKKQSGDGMPAGFHDRFPAVGDLPSWQQSLGQTTYNGPSPNFSGYNPLSSDPTQSTGYKFY